MVRTLMKHSPVVRVPLFLFLKHFGVICALLLNRRTVAGNPFVLCGPWKRSGDGAMRFPNHRHIIQDIFGNYILKHEETRIFHCL